ncbi:glycosyltransferase family 2 protein [Candidatus Woesebacteria bacterium]|nr:glycosyltransferase family 2 protein [Candidatus Woesebacteria bacterium]
MAGISVVINTLNEEKNLPNAISSIKSIASEIVVVDMYSEDDTVEIAKKYGAKVFEHKKTGYVEPARDFAISKATNDWILILDADEEVTKSLANKLKEIIKNPKADYYRLPRKNMIFGKWMKHTRWWPDYNIRFFKKGYVSWSEEIHAVPITQGEGADLSAKEESAIIHHNYDSVDKYLERMFRYTKVQSEMLLKNGYVFKWQDLIEKPLNEFLGRYFVGEGYKDGIHGMAISLLQGFSELTIYLRVWEKQGFDEREVSKKELKVEFEKAIKDFKWWLRKKFSFFGRFF